MADLAMADARRLVEAGAGLHAHAADALVLEHRPAFQHVDELHLAVVAVPLAVRRRAGARAQLARNRATRLRSLGSTCTGIASTPCARCGLGAPEA